MSGERTDSPLIARRQWINGISIIAGNIGFFLYMLPSVVGSCRAHHSQPAITMLNLLLDWTLLGWVLALVWACTATGQATQRTIR
jgi:hypothetical protein